MTVHESLLLGIISAVDRGMNVDISGPRMSGRSSLLSAVGDHYRSRRRRTITVSGRPMLKDTPLAALSLSGMHAENLSQAVDAVQSSFGSKDGVLLVDDWDYLDQQSWATIIHVHQHSPIPVVITRGVDKRTPSVFSIPGVEPARTFEIPMLDVPNLGRSISKRLSARLDASSLARVVALSGGNIGIAMAIIDTMQDHQMLSSDQGIATIRESHVWTKDLSALAKSLLSGLTVAQRTAMSRIAITGPSKEILVPDWVSPGTLLELEAIDMVKIINTEDEEHVIVRSPLLHEYLSRKTRKKRETGEVVLPETAGTPSTTSLLATAYIRMSQESTRARKAWTAKPSLHTAVKLAVALNRTRTAISETRAVLAASRGLPGSASDRLLWHRLTIEAELLAGTQPGDIQNLLTDSLSTNPDLRPQLTAAIIFMELLQGVEPGLEGLPEDLDTLPKDVGRDARVAVFATHLLRGRLDQAAPLGAWLEEQPDLTAGECVLLCLMDLTNGENDRVARRLETTFLRARSELKWRVVPRLAYIAGLNGLFTGRMKDASMFAEEVLALGAPRALPFFQQGLNSVAVEMFTATGRSIPEELTDAEFAPKLSPFPAASRAWQDAVQMFAAGRSRQGSRALVAHAEELWAQGLRLAGASAYLYAAYMEPSQDLVPLLQDRVMQVGGLTLPRLAKLLVMHCQGDLDSAEAYTRAIEESSPTPMTATAWRLLARGWGNRGDGKKAAAFTEHAARLEEAIRTSDSLDEVPMKLHSFGPEWTEREREIVRYVVAGMTNAEIAQSLVLSKRTVETHVARAMKKAQVKNRADLARHFE